MGAKNPTDLEKNPIFEDEIIYNETPQAPINSIIDKLTPYHGDLLHISSRITSVYTQRAVMLSYTVRDTYRSKYAEGKKDALLQLTISKDGLGRNELISALQVGGNVSDAYYMGGVSNEDGNSYQWKQWQNTEEE